MKKIVYGLLAFLYLSCRHENREIPADTDLLHRNEKQLTGVIIHDVFSPPVASRIYAYTFLASYEAIRHMEKGYTSITAQLRGFPPMPEPGKNESLNYLLAATKAFFTVAEKLTFSIDTIKKYTMPLYNSFRSSLEEEVYNNSIAFGESIGNAILERTRVDNYRQTRGMPKNIGSNEPGKWRPTPPDYLDAAEPHWGKMMPLLLDSATQIKCPAPAAYDEDTASDFYKAAHEVYTIGSKLTEEQKIIARYWDDNPFVTEHSGHLMYGNKKVTPVGHWIGITKLACNLKNTGAVETAQTYVLASVAMFDVIISCWEEKFRSQVVRPVTVINERIDRYWQPFLQTPPFPEHSSGHSGISAAAATVLTKRFGDNFAFEDITEQQYIGLKRNFKSFGEAAREASMSRVFGGIHYRTGVDAGATQGIEMGELVFSKLKLTE